MAKEIIGLSGTNGSGKDSVAQILQERHGFFFVSGTDLLRKDAREKGWQTDRKSLRRVSSEWKKRDGLAAFVIHVLSEYELVREQYRGVVVSSLRHPDEARKIHELGGTVVWVDADPRLRYERVQKNAKIRGREEEDNKTFEEFITEEQAEMSPEGNESGLDMGSVKKLADITILNEADGLDELAVVVGRALNLTIS